MDSVLNCKYPFSILFLCLGSKKVIEMRVAEVWIWCVTHFVEIDNVSVIVTYIYTYTNIRKLNGAVVAAILTFVS